MIKLVALDLDGTIVNANLEISDSTIAMLRKIQLEKNIKVVIATGRMFPSSLPFANKMQLTTPLIAYQGAMIREISTEREGNEIHHYPIRYHQPIDMEIAKGIIDFVNDGQFHANLYVNDKLFTTELNKESFYYQNISGVMPEESQDLHKALSSAPSKIMIIDDRAEGIVETLKELYSSKISVCLSRRNYCEIVHASVSKWEAVKMLMYDWNINYDEVMAIGDHENDLPMIMGAGIGIAMDNAPSHVKMQANHVTASVDEDGVVKAIEEFVYGIKQETA